MTIYYSDLNLATGEMTLYEVDFHKRAQLWLEHPNAVEISRKEYEILFAYTKTQDEKPT